MNPVLHTTFVIERELPASPRHAFRFWSDQELKRRWNDCHLDWRVLEDVFDFRTGGIESKRWRMPDGAELAFRADYFDILPGQRIIYGFEMSMGGQRISASLATLEFAAHGAGTQMKYTEQLAFLGGADAMAARIAGTGDGFDRLVELALRGTASVN
ncbi:SRPBCC family protein [Aminobacter sp. Piv2-1]|uniref:SRPBCC family protein n=1 Tax=Aminobacter sp. Piv2-1 TaxID=3031122 RepID=UPI00309EE05D